jgi:hypothetical protein
MFGFFGFLDSAKLLPLAASSWNSIVSVKQKTSGLAQEFSPSSFYRRLGVCTQVAIR